MTPAEAARALFAPDPNAMFPQALLDACPRTSRPLVLIVGGDLATGRFVRRKGLRPGEWRHVRDAAQAMGFHPSACTVVLVHGFNYSTSNREAFEDLRARGFEFNEGDVCHGRRHLFPDA